jgi:hypothetical protein
MSGSSGHYCGNVRSCASPDHRHLVATGATFSKVGDSGDFCVESVGMAFIETHLSPDFRWYP